MFAPNQDRVGYGARLGKDNAVDAAQQTTLRSNDIIQAARGSADMGNLDDSVVVTYPVNPTIDPITGLPDVEPMPPDDYFRVGDKLGSAKLKP